MTESTIAGLTTFVLHRVGVAGRRSVAERFADDPGLSLWQFAALAALRDSGSVAQNVVAAELGLDPSDMVRLMDELIAAGLVERDRDPADRRRYRVSLTEHGLSRLARAQAVVREVEQESLAPLTKAERAVLHELVGKVFDRPS